MHAIAADRSIDRLAFSNELRSQTERLLREFPGHAFCDECLAQQLGVGLREVLHVYIGLVGRPEFVQETWFCSFCLRMTHVIHVDWLSFDPPAEDDDETEDWH